MRGLGSQSLAILTIRSQVMPALWPRRSSPPYSVRPEGANHQWRKISPGELSIASVADERLGRVTDLVEAS
jgi:hypothetical protein